MKLDLDNEKKLTGPQWVGLRSHQKMAIDFRQGKEWKVILSVSRFFSLLWGRHW